MNLTAILLGLINIAIVVAVLLLIGYVIVWICSWFGLDIPWNIQRIYGVIVALIALYMIVSLLLGHPVVSIIHGRIDHAPISAFSAVAYLLPGVPRA